MFKKLISKIFICVTSGFSSWSAFDTRWLWSRWHPGAFQLQRRRKSMHHWTPFLGSQNGFQKRWLEKRELFMHFWYSKTTKIKVYDEQKEPFEKANKTLKKIFCAMCRRKVKSFFRGCILSRIVVCHKRIFQEMVPKESSQVLTALRP